jgi:hypothetical protein
MFGLIGGIWFYAAAFLAGLAAGAAGGYASKSFLDRPVISGLQTDLANAETRYKTREAQIEQDRADIERKALQAIQAQAQEAARLRTRLADAERRRAAASKALTAALNQAEMESSSFPLSPAALAYLAAVRAEQGGMP